MTVSSSSAAEPTTDPIFLDEEAFMIQVTPHSHSQHGHTGHLDAHHHHATTFTDPITGSRYVKKLPLLRLWQSFITHSWQPAAQRALKDHDEEKRLLSVKNYKLAMADARLGALDLSNLAVNRLRARVFLGTVRRNSAEWEKLGVAWWPSDIDDFLKVLAKEKRKLVRRERKEEQEGEGEQAEHELRGGFDEEKEAGVRSWLSKVLPVDVAEAKAWVTEEAKPFGRPAHVAVGVQAGGEQAEPLKECNSSA